MKRIIFLLLGACLCACGRYGCGVPAGYEPLLDAALADCLRADACGICCGKPRASSAKGWPF